MDDYFDMKRCFLEEWEFNKYRKNARRIGAESGIVAYTPYS